MVRRYGHFDTAEDAVQEALLAAATQWPETGIPDNPKAWLITVGSRRLTDLLRAEQTRQRREDTVNTWVLPAERSAPGADQRPPADDSLIVLFLCCHPSLSAAAQIALTLRAVGGLSTAEIARAFLVPEATMAQRISRAKKALKTETFRLPPDATDRLATVLHVLYLIFNEGYVSTSGPNLHRRELSDEAIRLTRLTHRLLPADPEVSGLLALMLLTDARRPARASADGTLIPLAEQDRTSWDSALITEGVDLITGALASGGPVGPYQLQAAVAACHDEAPTAAETDWRQIRALYDLLIKINENPLVRLNQAVAVAMVDGPAAGLALLADLESTLTEHHRLHAVRAHLLELAGDTAGARAAYAAAAAATSSLAEQRYLQTKAAQLA